MRKILVFSTNFLPNIGGAEIAIEQITNRLTEAEFSLITPRLRGALPSCEQRGRVAVYRVGLGFWGDKFLIPILGFLKARSLHQSQKFDALWCMMASQASVATAFFKVFNPRIPLLLTLQEGDEEAHLYRYVFGSEMLYRLFIRPWYTLVFKVADRITVLSRYLETRAREHALAVPIVLVPNGVDTVRFVHNPDARIAMRNKLGFSDGDFVIITVSRLVEKNAVSDIIASMSFLPHTCKLLIVGEGHLEQELRAQVSVSDLVSRVTFMGSVENAHLGDYLSASDAFVRPSLSEGFGISFMEAMAAGVPVIATPVGGIPDFLTDKKTGLFCGVRDPKDIALKVEVLMKDYDLRASIIEEAQKLARERYEWSAIAQTMNREGFEPLYALTSERILIATGIYPPEHGGPAKYAEELPSALRAQGHSVSVQAFSTVRLPSVLRHLVFACKILAPVRAADWIFVLDTFSAALPTVFLAWLFRKKTIIRIGGDFLWEQYVERTGEPIVLPDFYDAKRAFTLKEKAVFWLTKFVVHRATRLIFSTSWQRDIWLKPYGISVERTEIVRNFMGRKERAKPISKKNFVFAGRPLRLKNAGLLKEAFTLASRTVPDIELEFLSLPHSELMEHLSSSYAVVVPSLSEVSPNLVLEAIRYSKPFIATKQCGLYHELRELGMWVDPLREEELVNAIRRLSDDRHYEEQVRKLEKFSDVREWDAIARDVISVFKKL